MGLKNMILQTPSVDRSVAHWAGPGRWNVPRSRSLDSSLTVTGKHVAGSGAFWPEEVAPDKLGLLEGRVPATFAGQRTGSVLGEDDPRLRTRSVELLLSR